MHVLLQHALKRSLVFSILSQLDELKVAQGQNLLDSYVSGQTTYKLPTHFSLVNCRKLALHPITTMAKVQIHRHPSQWTAYSSYAEQLTEEQTTLLGLMTFLMLSGLTLKCILDQYFYLHGEGEKIRLPVKLVSANSNFIPPLFYE